MESGDIVAASPGSAVLLRRALMLALTAVWSSPS